MSRRGLVVSQSAWPTAAELRALGLDRGGVVRSLVDDAGLFLKWAQAVTSTAEVCALLQPNQTPGLTHDPATWTAYLRGFLPLALGAVQYVELANEQDIWNVPVSTVVPILTAAVPLVTAAGMRPILPSVAGPKWEAWARELARKLPPAILRQCWGNGHPYGRNPNGGKLPFGTITDMLSILEDIYGVPVVATESGVKIGDAGGEAAHATYTEQWCRMATGLDAVRFPWLAFFCWRDDVGAIDERGDQAFGLRRLDWTARPAWRSFGTANGGTLRDVPAESAWDGRLMEEEPPPPPPPPPPPAFEFILGMAAEAARLAALGIDIGTPLEPEQYPFGGALYAFQTTTRGLMVYSKTADTVHFLKAEGR